MPDRATDYFESKAVEIANSPAVKEMLTTKSGFSSVDSFLQSPEGTLFVAVMITHFRQEHEGRLNAARKL